MRFVFPVRLYLVADVAEPQISMATAFSNQFWGVMFESNKRTMVNDELGF
jgi:hypothetical protein